ncbi:hypothetical protein MVEN_01911300 [Mycena venus]|uniref:Uncharacterized protein n=1 Tax=Mycena venus TaxID=2733690 RepID=A0A8H6XG70_9AGAR|nr:hypothetical protein MVEN_01911300 [Mycena venus]
MANEDTHTSSLPELTPGSVKHDAPEQHVPAITPAAPAVADPVSLPLVEPNPITPVRSSLVPLGSQAQAAAAPPPPQPKRFSAVNINKKFLEKNSSSATTSAPASATSSASKTGGPVSRPQTQTATSHSRLVTTKLTAAPQSLSAPGSGWSRPSSATPPATTATTNINGAAPTTPGDSASSSSGPQHSHAASVIQPQPRSMPMRGAGSRENAHSAGGVGKPVWGTTPKAHQQQRPDMTSQSDFPTAAEVAAAPRKLRERELASAAANKQARMEEADTFRGVHLDPNAHHWDEMDADDDNFLDGVIEFGDGRQYKIESADLPTDLSSATLAATESSSSIPSMPSRSGSRLDRDEMSQQAPVSKEERFADDFDRSWPRSRASPSVSTRDLPGAVPSTHPSSSNYNTAPSPVSPAVSMASDSASRALLFNERSNKLEPYNRGAGAPGAGQKRSGGDGFPAASPTESRQFGSGQQPQLLQNRGRGFSGAAGGGGSAFGSERERGQQGQRRDGMSGPPPNAPQQAPRGPPPNPWMQRKDSEGAETRGRRLSAMGPPPVPPQASAGGRQRPPHLPLMSSEAEGGLPVRPQRRPSTSRESRTLSSATIPAGATEPPSARRGPSQSPALSHASAVAQSPAIPVSALPPQLSGADLDEVRKDLMQSAAARAKARRQQEEEEREKEKERARRKAAELEEKIKAAEAEKAAKAKQEEAARAQKPPSPTPVHRQRSRRRPRASLCMSNPNPRCGDLHLWARLRFLSSLGRALHGGYQAPACRVHLSLPPLQTSSSWRSKPSPISATPPVATSTPVNSIRQQQQQPPRPPIPTFVSPPSALEQVESLAENVEEREELEVVDFSDFAKFVGVTEEEAPPAPAPETQPDGPQQQRETPIVPAASSIASTRPPRPSAADFFDDRPPRSPEVVPASEKASVATWRRQSVAQDSEPTTHTQPVEIKSSLLAPHAPHAPSPHTNRTPRNQPFYKEATMSTLDDVMSRIKGAIDGMQSSEREHRSPEVSASGAMRPSSLFHASPANLSAPKERWVPSAFRARHQFDAEPQEVIITGCEPPRSPKPAWNTFTVRLPKISQPLEPVNRRQLLSCTKPTQFRWDVLSFDPPVEGMSRREFTINEILFRRTAFKGKSKYKVLLPNTRTAGGPRVNIPMSPRVNGVGAFGRPSAPADALSTWRKQPLASASKKL